MEGFPKLLELVLEAAQVLAVLFFLYGAYLACRAGVALVLDEMARRSAPSVKRIPPGTID